MKNAKYQILHDFQSSNSLALGTDYSYDYVKNKGIMLYFYNEALQNDIISISFKSFLESFSIGFSTKYSDIEGTEDTIGTLEDYAINYDIKLKIPSISLNDARVNASRLEELNNLIKPRFENLSGQKVPVNSSLTTRVLLANLIQNGSYTEEHDINTPSLIKKYGLRCYIEQISITADVDQGYFEEYDKLFYKSYDLDLSLQVFLKQDDQINNKRYIVGFDGGLYNDEDVKTWPFGVT